MRSSLAARGLLIMLVVRRERKLVKESCAKPFDRPN